MAYLVSPLAFPGSSHEPVSGTSASLRRLGYKLSAHRRLSAEEEDALQRWLGRSVRRVADRAPLIEQGTPPSEIHVVVDGWACRYRDGPNGKRQIVAFLLPGDVCDFNSFVTGRTDSTIEAICELQVACISRSSLNALTAEHPRLSQGLWWESMVSGSIGREWLVSLGQRNARQRLAHLLCELYLRLETVQLAHNGEMPFPITQTDLGAACGMTPEHTNRTLRELREAGLIDPGTRKVRIVDPAAIVALAGFDAGYLHATDDRVSHLPITGND